MNTPEARVERGPVAQNEPFAIGMAKLLERENRTVAAAELRWLHASCEDYAQHKQHQDQRVLELNAQRDALLEALKGVENRCASSGYIGQDGQYLKIVRAAISKVEGEQT